MKEEQYQHAEAFCLMQYEDEVTGGIEVLWNSRDGVTPFVIESPTGNDSHHVNWGLDERRDPSFIPTPGMRVFVDASKNHKHIRTSAKDYVDKYWESGMKETLRNDNGAQLTKSQAVDFFLKEWTKSGSPTVISAEEYLKDQA